MDKYRWGNAPEHLFTKKQLAELGLRPARGQEPVAELIWGYPQKFAYLFDKTTAIPKTAPSAAQVAALKKARQTSLANRTCTRCQAIMGQSKELRYGLCPPCQWDIERRNDREDAIERARRYMENPDTHVVLDVETTGMGWNAEIVEIAVVSLAGEVLLDTLVYPSCAITIGATKVHGLTEEDVAVAPTIPDIYPALCKVVRGKIVIAYNVEFDAEVVSHCLGLHDLEELQAKGWACAMNLYSEFVNDWSDYFGNYRWYPLPGALHRARGDCMATIALLRGIANTPDHAEEADNAVQPLEA